MKITENTSICRKQNKDTIISCGNSVEHERRRNGQSDSRMIENDNVNTNKPTERMLERILSSDNMNEAYQKVKRNKGAGGVDKMEMDELLEHLKTHREEILSRTIKDNRALSLIQKFLNAGIMDMGMFIKSDVGVPQGGPISPLLANIMLNELDQRLEEWGYRFVRYADDLMIFTKSKRAGQRQFQRVSKFIEGKLKLKINKEKTTITRLNQVKYLGYGFYRIKGKCRFRVHPKSISKLKDKLRVATGRSNGMSIEGRKTKLNQIIRGWVQYFKLADMKTVMQSIDEWLRRRIRMITWKRWKKVKTKFENLQKLGVAKEKAWEWANTRKSYWHTANSWILSTTLTNARFEKRCTSVRFSQ